MKLQIINTTPSLLKSAKNYFQKEYVFNLKNLPPESLIARYLVSKKMEGLFGVKNYVPETDENGTPLFEGGIFWSISHKEDNIAIAVSGEPVGIDLEIITARDESLFSFFKPYEWEKLGEKTWGNFYRLWTAKEALTKKLNLDLDRMKNISLIKINKDNLLLEYNGVRYEIQVFMKDKLVYSVG